VRSSTGIRSGTQRDEKRVETIEQAMNVLQEILSGHIDAPAAHRY
jgi:hypothetical protein